jgi:hypothetical protein
MQKPLDSLKTTRFNAYCQGFILADLDRAGFLRQHNFTSQFLKVKSRVKSTHGGRHAANFTLD